MTITLCDNYIVVPCVCVFPFVFCRLRAFHLGTDYDQGSTRKNLKKLLKVLGEVVFFFFLAQSTYLPSLAYPGIFLKVNVVVVICPILTIFFYTW